jgi:fructan beta-fructosidase
MKRTKLFAFVLITLLYRAEVSSQIHTQLNDAVFRPQIHFTPKEKWMNDPNGLVYHRGNYHLFYQYHPYSSVWGPMHWGHATSTDLIHWSHQPLALYPDSIGTIFSGSAVVDANNTAGFGKNALVAIFTQHNTDGERAGKSDFQNQSIAYSIDNGKTWTKYAGNPVLKNPGIKDFRDPKVMWYEPMKRWIMSLAVADKIYFYSSPDLKKWIKESEFGASAGAHGGVWECPDLFPLEYEGKKVWVLIVNLNPGGPNKGSATQYFLGDFDGKNFSPYSSEAKWLDYGPDEYAGITWENTGQRKVFIGWMSNWLYANVVPTETWRNAMTIPRELKLAKAGSELYIASLPVKEIEKIKSVSVSLSDISLATDFRLEEKTGTLKFPCMLNLSMDIIKDFSIALENDSGGQLLIGYDKSANRYFIDRSKSGKTDFHPEFAARHTAPHFSTDAEMNLTLLIDVSSVELFADNGLTVMTEIFFPDKPYSRLSIQSKDNGQIKKLEYTELKSIWE